MPRHAGRQHDRPLRDDRPRPRVSEYWGAAFVDVGAKGHINLASDLGDWSEGKALIEGLLTRLAAGP